MEPSDEQPWLLVPNPWYKGNNLNEPSPGKARNFLKNMLSEMNLNRRIDDWQSVQKRSPSQIGNCQPETGQTQRIFDLIH